MESRSSLRTKYSSGYGTKLNDREFIRWKPLSIEDFFYYEALSKTSDVVPAIIEDEVFKKCVTDKYYLEHFDDLPFGIVGTVVQNIMDHSGPISIGHFNDVLDAKRTEIQEPIHHLVTLVVRAFPAYKPEDVYAMSFDTFMLRVAQAESLLTMLGILQEPLALIDENEPPKKKQRPVPNELKHIFEKQQRDMNIPDAPTVPPPKKKKPDIKKKTDGNGVKFEKVDMSPEKSPIFNKSTKHPQYRPLGDLNTERITTERTVGSEEMSAERAKMVKDAAIIYKDLAQKMEFYKKDKTK